MANIGKLAVQITAETAGLTSGLKQAEQGISDFDGKATALANKLKSFVAPAAIAAGVAFAANMVRNVANTADELAKLSQRTGIAVEDLSRLRYAANMSGVSADGITSALTRLSRGMADTANGTGEAMRAFQAMGVEVKNQDGTLRSQREVLADIADRFASYEDGAQKSALAQQIFGRSGAELIPLLNGGAAGLQAMADESDRLGNTMDGNTARAAELFNDNISRLQTQLGSFAVSLGNAVIPTLAQMTTELVGVTENGTGMNRMAEHARTVLIALSRVGIGLGTVFQKAGTAIGGAAAAAASAARGRFTEARNTMAAMRDDLRQIDLDSEAAMERISAASAADFTPAAGVLVAAPILAEDPRTGGGGRSGGRASEDMRAIEDAAQRRADAEAKALAAIEERERAYWANRIQRFQDSLLTEEELQRVRFERDMERLNQATLTDEERRAAQYNLELEHTLRMQELEDKAHTARIEAEAAANAEIERIRQESLTNLERFTAMSYQEQVRHVAQAMSQQLTSVNTNSRAMFNIQKAANISQAVMDTYAGAARALKDYPAPLSFGIAAGVVAAGLSRVASIRSQSFGGASAAAGAAGGGGVAATTGLADTGGTGGASGASAARAQNVTIQLQGEVFGREQVRSLITQINEAVADGSVLRLA